jgi:putative FmdB family regulatory protein
VPIYEYQCIKCGNITERYYKVDDIQDLVECSKCRHVSVRIISPFVFHSQTPLWLDDSVRGALQDEDAIKYGREKPIETRDEYEKHLKNKGFVPLE